MAPRIGELFVRDPRLGLANGGQARIRPDGTEQAEAELKAELASFVCDGQYGRALQQVLSRYLDHLERPRQVSAWVSGYYGSGKSHLLKMLGHLWQNTGFRDGSKARSLVVNLPDEVQGQLRELDIAAQRHSSGAPLAAMGQLPAGTGELVRCTIASIVLEARGLPAQVPQAEFVFFLRERGVEAKVRAAVEAQGKPWLKEIHDMYVSKLLAQAVIDAIPGFAASEADARKAFGLQFPVLKADIDSKRFSRVVRMALQDGSRLPLAVLVLDEVQQYIGDSVDRAALVTEAIEVLKTELDSRLLVIGAGQAALSANTPTLQRLYGRFEVTTSLQDSDVEAVTRKVVLAKKPAHEGAIKDMLSVSAGEVARHLKGSAKLAARTADAQHAVVDYPLLATRRRFWEECFRAVDAQGHHSQLRSQLKVVHQAVADAVERPLGYVIPADFLYTQLADKLVGTGVLLQELHNRIARLDDKTPRGRLRHRVAGLVFMIGKLPQGGAMDLGVRATAEVIADLLVEDITVPSADLRRQVAEALEGLAADGTLMKVGDEYRLQTAEGAEWDRAYRERLGQLTQQPEEIEAVRAQRFRERATKAVSGVRLKQGVTKVPRAVTLHYDLAPPTGAEGLVAWVRDGWGTSEKEVLESARRGGVEDPTLFVYIPKKEADALRRHLTEALAAQRTLDNKGVPASHEAQEAQQSIASLKMRAEAAASEALEDIFRGARVFKGGGTEVSLPLEEALSSGAEQAASRRYPRFGEADFAAWPAVLARAKAGADDPFQPIGHTGPVVEHPVSKEVLRVVGAGSLGSKVRKELMAPPFGWCQDAIDAALTAMHRAGVLKATRNGAPVVVDQGSLAACEFRREQTVVSAEQRIKARGVCNHVGCPSKSGEEEAKCAQAVRELRDLGQRAGGEAPAPEVPSLLQVEALAAKSGAELVVAVASQADELKARWTEWTQRAEQLARRRVAWDVARALAAGAHGLPNAGPLQAQLEAIVAGRSLLADPDPVAPVTKALAGLLRKAIVAAHERHEHAVREALARLESDATWRRLDAKQREGIVAAHKLAAPHKPSLGTEDDILHALSAASMDARASSADLVRRDLTGALEDAARLLAPGATALRIEPATLATPQDVDAWVAARREQLLEAIRRGPVVVG